MTAAEGATSDQATACTAGVEVRVLRRGTLVRTATTAADGTYRVGLPDRPGRYHGRRAGRRRG